ncbi:MAG: type II CAAX prenyl endopeptidase Rce1 family protein [Candidatus Hermodarchaeota archaeon]
METPEKATLIDHCISIILIVFIFVFLLLQIDQLQTLQLLPLFLFIVFLGLNLIGYFMLLNRFFSEIIKVYLKKDWLSILLQWFLLPILVVLSFVLLPLAGLLDPTTEANFLPILFLYLGYVIIPVALSWLISQYLTKHESHPHPELRLFAGFLVILWVWWFIEFNFLPPIISGVPFDNLIAIITALWCFLIIINFEIPRSFAQLLDSSCWKTVAIWLVILFVIIAPLGLVSSFLVWNPTGFLSYGIAAVGILILTFIGIFVMTAVIEEFLFRGIIYQWFADHVSGLDEKKELYILIGLFLFVSILMCLVPVLGLADPIDSGILKDLPLNLVYILIGVSYFLIGCGFYIKTRDPKLSLLLWSSMLFGWAHFEDWRYIIFATIAGIGYCDTYRKTNNIFVSALVHASVNTIWGLIFA